MYFKEKRVCNKYSLISCSEIVVACVKNHATRTNKLWQVSGFLNDAEYSIHAALREVNVRAFRKEITQRQNVQFFVIAWSKLQKCCVCCYFNGQRRDFKKLVRLDLLQALFAEASGRRYNAQLRVITQQQSVIVEWRRCAVLKLRRNAMTEDTANRKRRKWCIHSRTHTHTYIYICTNISMYIHTHMNIYTYI